MLKYNMYSDNTHVGFFFVEEGIDKDKFTATLLKPHPTFAYILKGDCGDIDEQAMADWVYERIVPPTRQNIEMLLEKMGLNDYDQLDILKFTGGRSVHDDLWIDFSQTM